MEFVQTADTPETSDIVETFSSTKRIKAFGEAILKTMKDFPEITRPPIIAGGSIRDRYFGIAPDDYDIFMDVTGLSEETIDEFVVVLGENIFHFYKQEDERFVDSLFVERLEQQYLGKGDAESFSVYDYQQRFAETGLFVYGGTPQLILS